MNLIIRLLLSSVAVFIGALVLPGVHVDTFLDAIWVALVIGLLNVFVKPLLIFLTIPATIITLGLFLFVINAFIIWMASNMVSGFNVDNFWWALLFSILLSIINSLFNSEISNARSNRNDQN
jgi:putative membrane protein